MPTEVQNTLVTGSFLMGSLQGCGSEFGACDADKYETEKTRVIEKTKNWMVHEEVIVDIAKEVDAMIYEVPNAEFPFYRKGHGLLHATKVMIFVTL